MKKIIFISLLALASSYSFAANSVQDSILLNDFVLCTPKDASPLLEQAITSYTINTQEIESKKINSIKDFSTQTPNFYIPDHGSKISSSIYVRGIGSRLIEPSVGLYVDNIPYLDKSAYDFDFFDIQSISLLQGPQGTLYGRNSIGGLINIYTLSPFCFQGTRASVSYGNFNSINAKASHYAKLTKNLGASVAGYYNSTDGYFTNVFDGRTNNSESAGGRAKLEWQINQKWKAELTASFDHSKQNAYPYAAYDTLSQKAGDINYNEDGSYERTTTSAGLSIQRRGNGLLFTSATGMQYFEDDMKIDQDFTADSIFALTQKQKQMAVTQEFVLRSNNRNNYQWVNGLFGFYKDLNINSPMLFHGEGFARKVMHLPSMFQVADMLLPGEYDSPTMGTAAYHQSSYTFDDKLTLTAGIRVDYEKVDLDYNTSAEMVMSMPFPPFTSSSTASVIGTESQDFWQVLPKFAIKYQLCDYSHWYASIAKGYKAGGYNYALFSEIVTAELNNKPTMDIENTISYDPETSWNYEAGTHSDFLSNKLSVDFAVFYIQDKNQQMATYTTTGSRVITNADEVVSYGAELNLQAKPTKNLNLYASCGLTHSSFEDFNDTINKIDYTGQIVPFSPENTFSVGFDYTLDTKKKYLDKIVIATQYNGIGKIYWNEENTLYQEAYGVLNGSISLHRKKCMISAWVKNALEKNYNTFYFESMNKSFVQQGTPMTFGISLNYNL